MSRSQKQYIRDILEAMRDAQRFVESMTFEELEDDLRTQYAIQRTFEIIGEATKQVESSVRERYSDVPWREMAGIRDILAHRYFAVNLEVVWNAIHDDFPEVQPRLQTILEELPDDSE